MCWFSKRAHAQVVHSVPIDGVPRRVKLGDGFDRHINSVKKCGPHHMNNKEKYMRHERSKHVQVIEHTTCNCYKEDGI